MGWNLIELPNIEEEFNPENTFFIGQVFNWMKEDNIYVGCFGNKLLEIYVEQSGIKWKLTPEGTEEEVRSYLNLDISLISLLNDWKKDSFFNQIYQNQPGVRILKQPVFECLISFICSQNNNVKRISQNIESIKMTYGTEICEKYGKTWYAFPSPADLSKAKISELINLGLGYRAKYIVNSVERIVEKGGNEWLNSLKEMDYEEAKLEIMELEGIGPKVADCICLFGLNHFSTVPLDVHMWRIVREHYLAGKASKSMSAKAYAAATSAFVSVFGSYAGWAHSILYAASLKKALPLKRKLR
ncbi:unnamed protein product [Blepharisma stoltei]|uniref:DNA-(apurinic or apyrimidinic site) lyase n=1 Tax=Blepharisma stoltei TaxID=1481888 RepID=A0AAU9J2T2_9CILI|nr:unnamed protein product [Blepharisma stoltei]